jgi:hypothetical protein
MTDFTIKNKQGKILQKHTQIKIGCVRISIIHYKCKWDIKISISRGW